MSTSPSDYKPEMQLLYENKPQQYNTLEQNWEEISETLTQQKYTNETEIQELLDEKINTHDVKQSLEALNYIGAIEKIEVSEDYYAERLNEKEKQLINDSFLSKVP